MAPDPVVDVISLTGLSPRGSQTPGDIFDGTHLLHWGSDWIPIPANADLYGALRATNSGVSDTTCTNSAGTGQGFTTPDGSCLRLAGYAAGPNGYSWDGFDLVSGSALETDSSGSPKLNIMVCYLNGDGNTYCSYTKIWGSSELAGFSAHPANAYAHPYWINWNEHPSGNPGDGGTTCVSLDIHRCGILDPATYGTANANEIGGAAFRGYP